MITSSACPLCGTPLYADDVFCPGCGARREESALAGVPVRGATRALAAVDSAGEKEAPICPACGAPFLPMDTFCALCGEPVAGEAAEQEPSDAHPEGLQEEQRPPPPAPAPGPLHPEERQAPSPSREPAPPIQEVSPEEPRRAPLGPEQPETQAQPEEFDGWQEVRLQLEDATRGEFEIVRELGRGGMAAVYLARDLTLGRDVAIKVMAPGLLMGPGMVERFRQEAVTIAKLHHPNIVTIHTVGQAGNLHFFVMQFVEGASLEDLLARFPSIPIHLSQIILYQLGMGLSYAHRRGIVHRDIKPGNALLDPEGNAILTDFGIAKVTTRRNLTQTGSTIGTPAYMSPEQCRAGDLSGASDQYSLGVVAYELLTGKAPFEGSPFDIMHAHTAKAPPSIREQRPDCPPEIEAAVVRMLAKDPADRFPDVADAIEALGGYLPGPQDPIRSELAYLVDPTRGSEPAFRAPFTPMPGRAVTPAPEVTATPVPGKKRPRRRGPLWVGGAVAVVAAGVALAVSLRPWPGREASSTAEPTLPVVSRMTIPAPAEEILVGTSLRIRAELLDTLGQAVPGQAVEWSSDDPGVATVEGNTEDVTVTGVAPGTATLRAHVGGVEGTVAVVVAAPGAGEFSIRAPGREVLAGSEMPLTAILTDQAGQRIPDPDVSWSSSDPQILQVDPRSGVVRGVSLGRAQIRAQAREQTRTVELTVVGHVESIAVAPPTGVLRAQGSLVLKAQVASVPEGYLGEEGVRWSSSNPAVAVVAFSEADSVVLSLLSPGETVVTSRVEGFQSAVNLRVQPSLSAITVGLSTSVVTFRTRVEDEAPPDQTVTITVTGEGTPTLETVQYTGSVRGWLTPELGAPSGGRTPLVLRANPQGVGEGEYSARIPVRAGESSQELEVRLVVAPNPEAGPVRADEATAQVLSGLLREYQEALTAKNRSRVREIHPALSQADLDDLLNIGAGDRYFIQLVPGSLRLGPQEGTLEGDVDSGIIPPQGRGDTYPMIYTFARGERGWYIVSIRIRR